MTATAYVLTFLATGGGVSIVAGLFRIGGALGRLNQTIEDLGRRVERLENRIDGRGSWKWQDGR